jgi:ribosome-associated protein
MTEEELRIKIPMSELVFTSSRSSGPGGQNVNKVSSKVELRFNIESASTLSDDEKRAIRDALSKRITLADDLLIVSQSERTQLQNKKKCIERFYHLVYSSLLKKPRRRATSPTRSSVKDRLEKKRSRGSIKKLRRESKSSDDD